MCAKRGRQASELQITSLISCKSSVQTGRGTQTLLPAPLVSILASSSQPSFQIIILIFLATLLLYGHLWLPPAYTINFSLAFRALQPPSK